MTSKIPAHLDAVLKQNKPLMTEVRKPINSAFLGKNALQSDLDRTVVSADFDNYNRLVIAFDTGEKIVTKPINIKEEIEQQINISPPRLFDYVQFDTTAEVTPVTEGILTWNSEEGTLNLGMGNSNAVQQIGLETYIRIENTTEFTITDGKPIYFSGAGGAESLGGKLMITNGSINPLRFLGLTTQSIAPGQVGYVTNFGAVNNIDTTGALYGETWVLGDILYVSPTTAGALTKIRPVPPNATVAVGAVAKVGVTNGRIFVSPRIIPLVAYGSFNSTLDQTLSAANTATAVLFPNTFESSLINRVGNAFQFINPSLYSLNFVVNLTKSNASTESVWIWPRKNGVDIPDSAVKFTIQGNSTQDSFAASFAIKFLAGDTLEIFWAATSIDVSLKYDSSTAFAPASDSARFSIFQLNP